MKISMWMLHDVIANSIDSHNLSTEAEARKLTGVLPFLPDEAITDDHVYLIQASELKNVHTSSNTCLVICGDGIKSDFNCNCQYIRLQTGVSTGEALVHILKAFEDYNAWYDKLREALIGKPDLTHICEIGNELLENYITLFDPEHMLIAYASLPDNMIGSVLEKKAGPYYALKDEAYKAMVNRPDHEDDMRAEQAAFFFDPVRQLRIIYANVGPGRFECRLCIGEEKRAFKPSDPQICEILAEVLLTALQEEHSSGTGTKTHLRNLLHDLLMEQSVEDLMLDRNLMAWQWKRLDKYFCLVLEKKNPGSKLVSNDRYICTRIEELLPDACSFMLDGKIVCIARLLPDETPKMTVEKLSGFFSRQHLHSGGKR